MDKYIKQIADHYGLNHQLLKLVEEMSELTQAIIKQKLKPIKFDNLIEEIADTSLVLEQIIYLLGCEDKVSEIKNYKVLRTFKEEMGTDFLEDAIRLELKKEERRLINGK